MAEKPVFFSPARLAEEGSRIGRSGGTRTFPRKPRTPHEGLNPSTPAGSEWPTSRAQGADVSQAAPAFGSRRGGTHTYSALLTLGGIGNQLILFGSWPDSRTAG
jgi:hypothetical protein